jgi:DNA polymerase-3 subunit chi
MTRVDFHFNAPDKLHYGCRLLRKIHRSKGRAVIWCEDAAELARFDELLWTFSDQDFIPHVAVDDPLAAETPFVLVAEDRIECPHHDVLVNLARQRPPPFSRFERLVEIVSADPDDRRLARERWRFYKDRGYPLNTYDVTARPS